MHPPDELMVHEFLPAIRQLVARRLKSQGFSQNRIASMLGVTQVSVSYYITKQPGKAYSTLSQFEISHDDADTYAALLAEDSKRSAVDSVSTLTSAWTRILGSGAACARHRASYPSLADCDVCIKEYKERKSTGSEVIAEVADAVRMLETSSTFVNLMPEVSVNIACVGEGATSLSDVVAVPGRIVKVKGRAKAMLPPEPGASRHLSKILLLARKAKPDARACINLRYDQAVGRALKRLHLKTIEIGGYESVGEDPTVKAFEGRLASPHGDFDALIDEGGKGIEPNVYLFADGAKEAAELVLRISRTKPAA